MILDKPLLKLPVSYCPDTLEAEVRALPASAWVPHPSGFPGNEAVRLVTPGGRPTDALEGEMQPTAQLRACPYILQIMAHLRGVWGRSRLMGLAPGAEVPEHVDAHYYWRTHLRIHIPVITNPGVTFTCDGETVHMAPGECWVFDSFKWHEVHNRGTERRTHLVLDTVPTAHLWDLVAHASARPGETWPRLAPEAGAVDGLAFERVNAPQIMSPWEIRCHLDFISRQAEPGDPLPAVLRSLDRFADAWGALWARYGDSREGGTAYAALLAAIQRELGALGGQELALTNELKLYFVLDQIIFQNALAHAPAAAGAGWRAAS